jgi:PAS domain S-box-containing protein
METKLFEGKPVEERLRWLEAVIDSVHNGIVAVDADGRIILFNKAAGDILGFEKEAASGKFVKDVIPNTQLINTFEKGRRGIGKIMKINGKIVYTNRTPIMYEDQIIGAIAVFQDITEIENLKRELKEMENNLEILETVINSAYEGIIVVDKNGYITKFNRAYEDFLGIKEKDILGRHVTEVIENTRMHIVVKTGKKEIGHVQRIQGHDMIASRIPIKRNGKIIGAVGKVLFQDVKELKSLTQRLQVLESKWNRYKGEIKRMQEARYSFENIITQNKQMERINYSKQGF